jgi:hypothetical protein
VRTRTVCGVATRTDEPATMMEKKDMVRLVILLTLAFAGQAFAQQQSVELPEVAVTADCPKANEAEDVRFCDLTLNKRVKQAFEALKPPEMLAEFNGPFMQAYGDTSQFACTAVGPDGWCRNPFEAMAKK